MEKLTLVQIRAKFDSTVHSFSYTVFFYATKGQKTKVKGKRNESTAKQSAILRLYSSSEKVFAAVHLQKNSKLYSYSRPKETNLNLTPIL